MKKKISSNLVWYSCRYFYVPDMQDMPANCPARLSVRHAPQTPTDLEQVTGGRLQVTGGRLQVTDKFFYKGQFVIVKDGKAYNALGARLVD